MTMSYLQGLGYGPGMQGAIISQAPAAGTTAVSGYIGIEAGAGGSDAQLGAAGLLLILGGLVVLYVATRSIQGAT